MGQHCMACRQRDVGQLGFRYKRDTPARPRHEIPRRPRGVERNVRVQSRLLTGISDARLPAGPISPDADGICLPRRSLRRFHAIRRDDASQLLKLIDAGRRRWTCKTVPRPHRPSRRGCILAFYLNLTTTRFVTLVAPLMPVVFCLDGGTIPPNSVMRDTLHISSRRTISFYEPSHTYLHSPIPYPYPPAVFTFLILQRYSLSSRPARLRFLIRICCSRK